MHAIASRPETEPAGQLEQVELPPSANLPAAQLLHEALPGTATCPGSQRAQVEEAEGALRPAGQMVHLTRSSSGAKPALHVVQLMERSPLPATPFGGHGIHFVALALAYSPVGHATQRL